MKVFILASLALFGISCAQKSPPEGWTPPEGGFTPPEGGFTPPSGGFTPPEGGNGGKGGKGPKGKPRLSIYLTRK